MVKYVTALQVVNRCETTPNVDVVGAQLATFACAGGERFVFFFTLVTGPRRSLSLHLSDTRVYEPQIRARLGTTTHLCEVVVLKLRAVPGGERDQHGDRRFSSSSLLLGRDGPPACSAPTLNLPNLAHKKQPPP